MLIENFLKENKISMYELAQKADLPYATIHNICSGKTDIRQCSYDTVDKIATALKLPIRDVVLLCKKNYSFSMFKSAYRHKAKIQGEIDFVIEILQSDEVKRYWRLHMYKEAFYLVAMTDYFSRKNNINIFSGFDEIRSCKLKNKLYSSDVLIEYKLTHDDAVLVNAEKKAIPEFLKYNIVEGGF